MLHLFTLPIAFIIGFAFSMLCWFAYLIEGSSSKYRMNDYETNGSVITFLSIIVLGIHFFVIDNSFLSNLFTYASHNLLKCFGYFVAYVGCGLIWSFYKWYDYLLKYKKYLLNKVKETESYSNGNYIYNVKDFPQVSDKFDMITTWIFYWPISILRFTVEDLFTKIKNAVFSVFEKFYQGIFNMVTKN